MAIVIEEQKNKSGVGAILIGAVAVALVGIGVYYIFWKKPNLAEVAVPPAFQNTKQLIDIGASVNPENVLQSVTQTLRRYTTSTTPQNLGRANPFISF